MTAQLPSRERLEQYANDPRMCNVNDEIRAMARALLAAHEQEPVATLDVQSGRTDGKKFALVYSLAAHQLPDDVYFLHIHPAPVPAVPDDKLYARPQPASVDLPNIEVSTLLKIMSGEIRGNATVAANLARHLLKAMSVPKATKQTMRTWFPSLSDYECVVAADVWNACRAAMLNGGKS